MFPVLPQEAPVARARKIARVAAVTPHELGVQKSDTTYDSAHT